MKKVRALDFDGEYLGVISSKEVSEETRYAKQYCCLDPECGAKFHWKKSYKRDENTREVDPTFARNPSSEHREGCAYDYEAIASYRSDVSFMKEGKYFLRINFPMGSHFTDKNPRHGRFTRIQREAAIGNTGKKSVGSLEVMVKFLEDQFGSLEHPALDNLYLDYQGRSYPWSEVITEPDNYKRIYDAATAIDEKESSILAVVSPIYAIDRNRAGKARFQCAYQFATAAGHRVRLAPVLVAENDEIAAKIRSNMRGTFLVSARPFVPDFIQNRIGTPDNKGRNTQAYLHIIDQKQITPIDDSYWKEPKPAQMTLDLDFPAQPASKPKMK